MRVMRLKWSTLFTLITLLSACASSPPVQFYTIDPVDSPHPATDLRHAPVQVGVVHVPPALDRKEMVGQNEPNMLTISEQNRWGAPLPDMLRRVLTQDLIQRLPQTTVILPDSAAPPGTRVVVLDILQLQREVSGSVVLDGSWSISAADSDEPGPPRHVSLQKPAVRNDYAAQAQAMSQLVGQLADLIAAALANASANHAQR